MSSHESFYTSANIPTSAHHPSIAGRMAPPPPPPPKPNDVSRTGTPSTHAPPIPPHPNASQSHLNLDSSARSSPAPYQQSHHHITPTPYQQPQQSQSQAPQQQQPQQPPLPQPPLPPLQQPQHTGPQSSFQLQPPTVQAPPIDSGWLPDGLKDHSTSDLQPLLTNPEQLDAFAKQHPAYAASLEPLQAAVATNLALAQHVAQLEAQVKKVRDQTGQLLLNHTSLQTQWRRKQSEMDNALSSWGPRAMYSRLVSSINEQEAVLRAVHESFVEGGADTAHSHTGGNGKATEKEVTEWVKRIREGATTLERRREMRQRWDEGRVGGWR